MALKFRTFSLLAFCMVFAFAAPRINAEIILPSDVTIFGTYVFDEDGSFAPPAANQNGAIFSVIGGIEDSRTEYSSDVVTSGTGRINAVFTHHGGGIVGTGDGFGGTSSVDATDTFSFRADTDLDNSNPLASPLNIVNNSASQRYRFEFSLTYNHQVDATGDDAGLRSDIDLELDGERVFNSELISDTIFGNVVDGLPAAGSGGLLSASGTHQFAFVLDPGEFSRLALDYTMESADYPFISDGQTIGAASYFISIDNVVAVPEPGTMAIFGLGLVTLGFRRRQR